MCLLLIIQVCPESILYGKYQFTQTACIMCSVKKQQQIMHLNSNNSTVPFQLVPQKSADNVFLLHTYNRAGKSRFLGKKFLAFFRFWHTKKTG